MDNDSPKSMMEIVAMTQIPAKQVDLVLNALRNKNYKWRTPRGISKETKIDEAVVREILKLKDRVIVQSTVPSKRGEDLFTLRETFTANTNFMGQLFGALKGRAR